MSQPILLAHDIFKSFPVGAADVPVLRGISFTVASGDFLVIFGPSGCGKSTFLHTVLGLEPPTSGTVSIFGTDLYADGMTDDDRSEFRKRHIGMVYQQPNWIRSLSVVENVAFPLALLGEEKRVATERARQALSLAGMLDRESYFPMDLSSGQQQRVALARAIVTDPDIIIADEPTGNLDYESGQALMELLKALNGKADKTVIMVTHDLEYLGFAKTAIRMFDGKIVGSYDEHTRDELMSGIRMKSGKMTEAAPIREHRSRSLEPERI